MKPLIAFLMIALGLVGCTTNKPLTYLVLSPVPGPVYPASGQTIAVGDVSMPPSIDRSALTTGSSDTTLNISYDAQWAAPLGAMAQTVLARDLAIRLPGDRVLMPGDNVPGQALIVSANIVTFLPYAGHVVLAADWNAATNAAKTMETGRVQIITPSSAVPQAQALAMSQALGHLADEIASRIVGTS